MRAYELSVESRAVVRGGIATMCTQRGLKRCHDAFISPWRSSIANSESPLVLRTGNFLNNTRAQLTEAKMSTALRGRRQERPTFVTGCSVSKPETHPGYSVDPRTRQPRFQPYFSPVRNSTCSIDEANGDITTPPCFSSAERALARKQAMLWRSCTTNVC